MRCPVTGDYYDCGGSGILLKTGGNPSLQPETSQQVNAGFVLEPLAGLSTSVDYYWVRVENTINRVPTDVILGPDHAVWAPGYVVRGPPDAQYPDLPGKIAYVVQYPTNVGTITTSGIDINLQWRGTETSIGRFSLSVNGTYVIDFSQSGYESASVPPSVGTRGLFGAIARYRQYGQLNWTSGPWGATLANTYQSGYMEPCVHDQDGTASIRAAARRVASDRTRSGTSRDATPASRIRRSRWAFATRSTRRRRSPIRAAVARWASIPPMPTRAGGCSTARSGMRSGRRFL